MHTIEKLIKELLADSPSLKAVLLVTAMLEEQRDELLKEIQRMAKQTQPAVSVERYEQIVMRNARLETAIIGVYAILNIDGDLTEQIIKISRIIDEVAAYKAK
jgi:hypothetical protein